MSALFRLDELIAMVRVKWQFSNQKLNLPADAEDLRWCYDILQHVSRSFAAVIMQLHPELRDAVMIFYLALRGLDTIEDDMKIPFATKQQHLPKFHENLSNDKWCIDGIGEAKEKELLQQFFRVARVFMQLKKEYRDVIADITERMAFGMLRYLPADVEVNTTADFDEYCHYVAGIVGHGLTRLFACSGLEDAGMAKDLTLANSMGLFLQAVNICRDIKEDCDQDPPRLFWPREIWGMFAPTSMDLVKAGFENRGRECLNAMIAHAARLIPDCLAYMAQLHEPSVFLFCAIPQVMAIATLAELYNNPAVFRGKVKISKGATCKIILNSTDMPSLLQQFETHCTALQEKLVETDPSYDTMRVVLHRAKEAIREHAARLGCDAAAPSYARRFLTQYPALGGRVLFNFVDAVKGFLQPAQM